MHNSSSLAEFVRTVFSGVAASQPQDSDRLHPTIKQAVNDEFVKVASTLVRHELGLRGTEQHGWWSDAYTERELWEQLRKQGDPIEIMNLAAMIAVKRITAPEA